MTHIDEWYFREQTKYVFRKAAKAQVNLMSEAAQDQLIKELLPIVGDILSRPSMVIKNYLKQENESTS